jgi:putative membrane protein PagO
MVSLRAKKYFAYGAICVIWGSSWAAVKLGLQTVPPLCSAGLRFSLAAVLLGLIVLKEKLETPRQRSFWMLVLIICATSFTIPFGLVYWAQQRIDSGVAAVTFATFPLWVAVFSHFVLPEERMTASRWLGMSLGFAGIAVVFRNNLQNYGSASTFGLIAVLTAASIQALGLVALRKMGQKTHPVILNFWSMLISALILLPSGLISEGYSKINLNLHALLSLVYLASFSTVFTFVAYFWLAKHVEAVILSLSAFITPVLALFIGGFLMAEMITGNLLIGSLIILAGIVCTNLNGIMGLAGREKIKREKDDSLSRMNGSYRMRENSRH